MTTQPNSLDGMRILLVDDDERDYRPAIERALREMGARVQSASTVQAALAGLLASPHVIILDMHLPDGSGLRIAEEASRMRPPPRIIAASGSAQPADSFKLGRMQVDCFLPKPYGLHELRAALAALRTPIDELADVGARTVGIVGLIEARDVLRDSMVVEALEQSDGNRTQAARMLGVTRQAVQSAVRE